MLAGATGATSGATWGYLGLLLNTGILGIMDIYANWGYLWGYLGLPNLGDHGYLCWLGLLGLPLGVPGATCGYL
jgi:hypothetical protein